MTDAERKAKLEERVKTLKEMRDVMLADEHWESMKRLIEAVTAGAMAIQRIIKEDFGEENAMTPQEYRKIQRWKKERDEAIRETCKNDDLSIFKAFYEKYKAKGVYKLPLPTDDILELSIRKMLYHMASATVEERRYAKRWLEEHGSTTSIGGRGMMMRGDEDDE